MRGPTRSLRAGSSRSSSATPEGDLDGEEASGGERGCSLGRRNRCRSRHGAGRDRVRRAAERRQVEPAQRAARRGAGDRLGRARDHARCDRHPPGLGAERGRAHRHRRHPTARQGRVRRRRRALLDDARADRAVACRRRGARHRRRRGSDVPRCACRRLRGRGGEGPGPRGQQVGPRRGQDATGPSTSTSTGSGTTPRSWSSRRSSPSARRPASASVASSSWRSTSGPSAASASRPAS